jgi:hypothetical protein
MKKRDTYLYAMRDHYKVVQYGMTKNPDVREFDHRRDGKRFTNITFDMQPRTRDNAKTEETRRINTYKSTHNGRKPRYNKIL